MMKMDLITSDIQPDDPNWKIMHLNKGTPYSRVGRYILNYKFSVKITIEYSPKKKFSIALRILKVV